MSPPAHSIEPSVCVAAVATAHGLKGAVRLRCFTERPENVAAYGPVFAEDGRRFALEILRVEGPATVVARLDGVADRNAAEALRGLELRVPRAVLPPPEEDEFYHEDLIGLEALDTAGAVLGRVRAVQDFGAGDVIEVAAPDGRLTAVPFTKLAVPKVDLAAGFLVIDPPREVAS